MLVCVCVAVSNLSLQCHHQTKRGKYVGIYIIISIDGVYKLARLSSNCTELYGDILNYTSYHMHSLKVDFRRGLRYVWAKHSILSLDQTLPLGAMSCNVT